MSKIERETKETTIVADVRTGSGAANVRIGDRFLAHMVETLARYASLDIDIEATGDLRHHLVEDVAIVLGKFLGLMLFVLVLGIINFGVLFGQQLALNHAVREGARAAVVQSTGQNADGSAVDVPTLVRNAVSGVAMDPADVTVTNGACPGDGGKRRHHVDE